MDDIKHLCHAVRNAADLRNLPGYVERVNPAEVGLKQIIRPYEFKYEIRCALTNCGRPHKDGVIVQLEDGSISNIGHICGADENKFSTKFTIEMQVMSNARRREELLPRLLDRVSLQQIEDRARVASDMGRRAAALVLAFRDMCPDVFRELQRRVGAGESLAVSDVVERSESEIGDLIASGQARNRSEARYKEVVKGHIAGTSVLALSQTKLDALERRARSLLAADPQAAKIDELQKLYHEATYLPEDIAAVASQAEAAGVFFAPANFELMTYLPASNETKARLKSLTVQQIESRAKQMRTRGVDADRLAELAPKSPGVSKKERARQKRLAAEMKAARQVYQKK
ncbi:hypothetical protein [Burkholderia gladioli]|uniref:hypothetical protein n=1 Tax=Burkholderia gladioli TaxID=28095 RepID=UPI0012F8906E|nr:hypothetical protein [Burkholderia gladioli]